MLSPETIQSTLWGGPWMYTNFVFNLCTYSISPCLQVLCVRLCMLYSAMILAGWPLSTEAARLRCGSDLLSDLIFVCGDRGIYLGKSILIVSTLFCINILWHLRSCQWKQIFLCTSGNCKSNWKVGEIPNCTGIQPLENGKQANTRTFRYKQTMSYWSPESWAWTAALIQISALTQNKTKKSFA